MRIDHSFLIHGVPFRITTTNKSISGFLECVSENSNLFKAEERVKAPFCVEIALVEDVKRYRASPSGNYLKRPSLFLEQGRLNIYGELFHSVLEIDKRRGTLYLDSKSPLDPVSFKSLFTWYIVIPILGQFGLYAIHCAVLSKEGIGFIFSGDSGCGKSTVAFFLVTSGWDYLCDDIGFLRFHEGKYNILGSEKKLSIYRTLLNNKFNFDKKDRIDNNKIFINPMNRATGKFLNECKVDFVIHPKLTKQKGSKIQKLNRYENLKRIRWQFPLIMFNSFVINSPDRWNKIILNNQVDVIMRLMDQIESYELIIGNDVYDRPNLLGKLLLDSLPFE